MCSSPVFDRVCTAHPFNFLCCLFVVFFILFLFVFVLSSVPNVACVSLLSFCDFFFYFQFSIMFTFMNLVHPFLIAPSVFSNVYVLKRTCHVYGFF